MARTRSVGRIALTVVLALAGLFAFVQLVRRDVGVPVYQLGKASEMRRSFHEEDTRTAEERAREHEEARLKAEIYPSANYTLGEVCPGPEGCIKYDDGCNIIYCAGVHRPEDRGYIRLPDYWEGEAGSNYTCTPEEIVEAQCRITWKQCKPYEDDDCVIPWSPMDWIMFSWALCIPLSVLSWAFYRYKVPMYIEVDELGGFDLAADLEKKRIQAALWGSSHAAKVGARREQDEETDDYAGVNMSRMAGLFTAKTCRNCGKGTKKLDRIQCKHCGASDWDIDVGAAPVEEENGENDENGANGANGANGGR